MSENKSFELSKVTKFKSIASTAMLVFGAVGIVVGKSPEIMLISTLCLVYSYIMAIDARLNALEDVLKSLGKKNENNESNR